MPMAGWADLQGNESIQRVLWTDLMLIYAILARRKIFSGIFLRRRAVWRMHSHAIRSVFPAIGPIQTIGMPSGVQSSARLRICEDRHRVALR